MWKEFVAEYKQAKKLRHYMLAVSFISLILPLSVFAAFIFEFIAFEDMETAMTWVLSFMLLLLCVVSFIQANTQGIKDKRRVVSTKVYPLKGVVLGIAQQLPFWVVTGILLLLRDLILPLNEPWTELFRNYAVNVSMLQYTGIMKLFDYNWLSYLLAFCLLPLICELGYLLAYIWKIDIDDMIGGMHKN